MECFLKQRREELGFDIERVAKATKIKASYLRAIEDGDFSKLPVNVYTKGYMRQYAQFLGAPSEGIVEAYEAYLHTVNARDAHVPVQGERRTEQEQGVSRRSATSRLSRSALLAVTILISLVGVYLALPQKREAPQLPERLKPEVPAAVEGQPAAPQAEEPAVSGTSEPRQAARHSLQVVATDRVWLQVIIDGGDTRETLLQPGEKVTYDAHDSLVLKVGNAGGVLLKYNERDLEPLGNKGEVVRLSFPESGILQNPRAPQGSLSGEVLPPSEASQRDRDSHVPPQP